MTLLPPDALADKLKSGLLSFPVTHFDADLQFDEARYREHLAWQSSFDVAGLFAAGGTGEGFSLTLGGDRPHVVRVAVEEAGSTRAGPRAGDRRHRPGRRAGAAPPRRPAPSGLLLFPPYLTEASQAGLVEHVSAVCRATDLGVIVYSRANAVLDDVTVAEVADRNPNLIGLKDGVGDIEQMTRTYAKVGDRLIYVGGLPTAETFALPLLQLGVSTYSSALYNFLPEFALTFYAAVRAQDRTAVYPMLNDFVIPYLDIRDRAKGLRGLHRQGRPDGRSAATAAGSARR